MWCGSGHFIEIASDLLMPPGACDASVAVEGGRKGIRQPPYTPKCPSEPPSTLYY